MYPVPGRPAEPEPALAETNPVGIQVGTAVTTLVRKADHDPAPEVRFRHLWGRRKREELLETADAEPEALYEGIEPSVPLGMPFLRTAVDERWFDWPALPDLFPVSFPGVKTDRDRFLVDIDLDRLRERVNHYFDRSLSHDEIERRYPAVMRSTAGFDARSWRDALVSRGGPVEDGFCRFAYRPFDDRWLYWEPEAGLLDRPRPDYHRRTADRNLWLTASQHVRKDASEPQAVFTSYLGSHHLIERGSNLFPAYLRQDAAIGAIGGLLSDGGAPAGGLTSPAPVSTTWTDSVPRRRTSSTSRSPRCTMATSAPPTPTACASAGRVFPCRAGRRVLARVRQRSSPQERNGAANSPDFSIWKPPCPAWRPATSARRSQPSPSRPRSTAGR